LTILKLKYVMFDDRELLLVETMELLGVAVKTHFLSCSKEVIALCEYRSLRGLWERVRDFWM